jgi:hypothetical protein
MHSTLWRYCTKWFDVVSQRYINGTPVVVKLSNRQPKGGLGRLMALDLMYVRTLCPPVGHDLQLYIIPTP